jgi:ABC-type transport system involved in multi-copper enzyme maturation permease subunit
MSAIRAIAALTVKEAIRNKILYLLLVFSLGLISFSLIMGELTIGDELKIIKDLGLSSIHFFGILITIFIGIGLIFQEMEKRTIYLVLSKPLRRYQFLLGKFIGLAVTLFLVLTTLVFLFYGVLFFKGDPSPNLLLAFGSMYLEWLMIAAIAILFSSFSTPLLSGMLTLAAFLAGHLTDGLLLLKQRIDSPFFGKILSGLFYALPNLELFNLRTQVVHNLPISVTFLAGTWLYWGFYLTTVLLLSILIFQKKDFV